MASFLVTYHPAFRGLALREVALVDPGVAVLERLGPAVTRVAPSAPPPAFVRDLRAALPVFVRHLAPVDLELALDDASDPLQALVDAFADAPGLEPGAPFAVQCRRLDGEGAPWGARDVEVRLGSRLEAAGFEVRLDTPAQVVSVALLGRRCYAGASRVEDNLNRYADEHRRFSRWPAPVSRAEFKLREALAAWDVRLPPAGRALDLGAAPGGWTNVLAQAGLHVVAVDAAGLAEPVAASPLVTHVRARVEAADPGPGTFDLLVDDMNLDPGESAALLCRSARWLAPGAPAVVTLKLSAGSPLHLLRGALAILQHAYEVRGLRSFFHNRREVTALLARQGRVAPGWEELVGHDPGAARRRREWCRCHGPDTAGEGIPLLLRASG